MCQISRKIHGKSFENSRAPQTLFQGAAITQTKKFLNNEYLLHLSQDTRQSRVTVRLRQSQFL